jgi:hypothetical protein
MAFNTLDELKAAVEERRKDTLTLEVDMGASYSPEYEEAKQELEQARAMKSILGGQEFLGDNIGPLEDRVRQLKPEPNSIWIRYRKLDLGEWSALVSAVNLNTPIAQYEKVLPKTFVGVWGTDPSRPDDLPEDVEWVEPEPLSTDASLLSSKGLNGILPGGALHSVVQSFMAWQNSGGDVTIRPTKSGRV